jgi:AraC family transcriptional regulator of arabinose operon
MGGRIRAAVDMLHRHLDRSWRVEELAARVHLSASRFAHLFRAEMGVSPARYVKTLRLVRAKELLETSFLTVKEVMVSVGLSDASHFVRDFKRHHGMRPGDVRRRRRGRGK